MKFYEDRASIVKINEKEIYLFKNRDNEIKMEYYNLDKGHNSITICKDAYGEFDTIIDGNKINLVYQNTENKIKLLSIDKLTIEDLGFTLSDIGKTYEIKINMADGVKGIIYLLANLSSRGMFEIRHSFLKDNKWHEFIVADLRVSKFLNPIKLLTYKNNVYLFFYNENEICLKRFDTQLLRWKETIVLTDKLEKMYIDVLMENDYIYLTYSEYVDGNLSIRYKKY